MPKNTRHQIIALLKGAPRRALIAMLACMVAMALTEGVSFLMLPAMLGAMNKPIPMPHLLARLFGNANLTLPLGLLLCIFVGLVALRMVLQYTQSILAARVDNGIVDSLRLRCFAALMGAEWRLIAQKRQSDHNSLIISNINQIGFGISQLLQSITLVLTAAACFAAALVLSWKLALFALLCGLCVAIAFAGQRRRATQLGAQQIEAYNQVHAEIQDGLAGIRIAKVFQQEQRHIARVRDVFITLRAREVSFLKVTGAGRIALNVGGAILLALVIYLGVSRWQVPINSLLPLVLVFARLLPVMSGLQNSSEQFLHTAPALASTFEMLELAQTHAEPHAREGLKALPLEQNITLQHVTINYEGRKQPALADVSLVIPVCTTTAIIGHSGAGKSTFADILMGLIEPDGGTVLVDGVPLTGEARMRWRQSVAYVQQDAFLFNDSIRANLLWACPHADETALRDALEAAAATFAYDLPDGLETIVGDGGVRLSGGERQRIVLARALLRKPSLLILDEATSALDPANERTVRQAITKLHGALTVIILGHRIAMIEHADQVISLKAGRASVSDQG